MAEAFVLGPGQSKPYVLLISRTSGLIVSIKPKDPWGLHDRPEVSTSPT